MEKVRAHAGRAAAASKLFFPLAPLPTSQLLNASLSRLDIAEALFDGSTYLKSTLHTNTPGGDSDYLVRPTNGTMKLAVIFSSTNATIQIQVLPDNTGFGTSLSSQEIEDMCGSEDDESVSLFTVT
jgi:hypothetical protein